jgi:hypothetical protein
MKQKALIIVVAILALAVLAFWYVNRSAQAPTVENTNSAANNSATPTNQTPANQGPGSVKENTVAVTGQQAGASIIVDQVNLADEGFVVIYESNNGQLGKVAGSSKLLSPGTKLDLVINVTTKPGTAYIAAIHTDNGDGKFNATQDAVIKDAQGKNVISVFSTVK